MRYDLWKTNREQATVLACGLKVQLQDVPKPALKIWRPKATKPYVYYSFYSVEQRDKYLAEQVANFEAHTQYIATQKEARKGNPDYTTQRTRDCKAALAPIFGYKYVHVKQGKGTASSWVHIHVYLPKPNDCNNAADHSLGHYGTHCEACAELSKQAEMVVHKAVENIKFSSYTRDDGYGTQDSCLIVNVHIGEEVN
jgi:hypothetical protein